MMVFMWQADILRLANFLSMLCIFTENVVVLGHLISCRRLEDV